MDCWNSFSEVDRMSTPEIIHLLDPKEEKYEKSNIDYSNLRNRVTWIADALHVLERRFRLPFGNRDRKLFLKHNGGRILSDALERHGNNSDIVRLVLSCILTLSIRSDSILHYYTINNKESLLQEVVDRFKFDNEITIPGKKLLLGLHTFGTNKAVYYFE
mmetsp:Transcript_32628/g.75103  ORF Transcript_32628/g.75103 Transcript_32628/m.75103 type:complete len:160 (-) Transcript_32628:513-992(-)